jgi:2-polyprenyl-3-methyl-5-hydroxy-6-metoxy-1,4-benzoquinol methylase
VNFARRNDLSELMDTEPVTPEDFAACLKDLATVNRLTLAMRPTFLWLNEVTGDWPSERPFSVLDVGYGQGDMLRAIWHWAQRRGLKVELEGIDLNPLSEYAARQATPEAMKIRFRTGDVFALGAERRFDVIISSLVTHHLTDAQIVAFIRLMERQTMTGWFINDLHRHALSYHAFRLWAAVAGWHRFVRHDGPVSIARSFRRADWESYLTQAGVDADIDWHMPFRFGVGHTKVPRS